MNCISATVYENSLRDTKDDLSKLKSACFIAELHPETLIYI